MLVKVRVVAGQVSTQQSRMSRKDARDRQAHVSNARDRDAGHPPVKMREDRSIRRHATQLTEKFGQRESEGDDLVHLAVTAARADTVIFPQQILIGVERVEASAVVQEDHARTARYQP